MVQTLTNKLIRVKVFIIFCFLSSSNIGSKLLNLWYLILGQRKDNRIAKTDKQDIANFILFETSMQKVKNEYIRLVILKFFSRIFKFMAFEKR